MDDALKPIPARGRTLGRLGGVIVAAMIIACVGSLPYTFGRAGDVAGSGGARRFEQTRPDHAMLPPSWARHKADERAQVVSIAQKEGRAPRPLLGTDRLGRSIAVRVLAGGGISLAVGFSAAMMAVLIGTLYGTIAGWAGGRIDSVMMRLVDILYGLPYILLVVLLAVAAGGLIDRGNEVGASSAGILAWIGRHREIVNIVTLLIAIGVPLPRQFLRHLLPNLLGPIIVYATLTVPSAILSESFLSFLGIGVQEPLPSWGNLAATGLSELNIVRARWWLLVFPCATIAITLLALNFLGEGLRERFDPKRVK